MPAPSFINIRFSTAGDESSISGAPDTARDPHGFAIKIRTNEGNFCRKMEEGRRGALGRDQSRENDQGLMVTTWGAISQGTELKAPIHV